MIMLQVSTWSRLAAPYAFQLPLEREALRALASMLDLNGSSRLLDIATGTGAMLTAAARRRSTTARNRPGQLAADVVTRVTHAGRVAADLCKRRGHAFP